MRQSIDHDSNADDSEEQQDSGCVLGCGSSPGGDLFKRVAANKIHRQHLSECVECTSAEQQSVECTTGGQQSIECTPAVQQGTFEIRQDTESAKMSDGQVTARLLTENIVQEDTPCSGPVEPPQVLQTEGDADIPVLPPITAPPIMEQLDIQSSVVVAAQGQTQSTSGTKHIIFIRAASLVVCQKLCILYMPLALIRCLTAHTMTLQTASNSAVYRIHWRTKDADQHVARRQWYPAS